MLVAWSGLIRVCIAIDHCVPMMLGCASGCGLWRLNEDALAIGVYTCCSNERACE